MDVQIDKLAETQTAFATLDGGIVETVNKILEIKVMVESLNEEIKVMVDVISNLSAISQENSASTQETFASIEELNTIISQVDETAQKVNHCADAIMNDVDVFKTV